MTPGPPDEGIPPLTSAQRGILAGHLLAPEPAAYNTAEYVFIDGPLDPELFERALRTAVAEADALNVRIVDGPDGPGQRLGAAPKWALDIVDLSECPDPYAAEQAWMAEEVSRPLDLFGDRPLFAHALIKTAAHQHVWYHRVHHILLDGYGAGLLARRVAAVYTALAAGDDAGPRVFGELRAVLDEEAAYAASKHRPADRDFWLSHLADRPTVIGLGRYAAPPAQRALRVETTMATTTQAGLRSLAGTARATWAEAVIAATALVLCRREGREETVLGLPAMNRMGTAALRVPATVLNVVPLRIRVGSDDTLARVTRRVGEQLRATRRHHRYRSEDLARDLRLVGGGRRLFATVVNVMPFDYTLRFADALGTAGNVSAGPVADLSVNVYDRGDESGVRLTLDANPACCSPGDLDEFRERFTRLLSDPDSGEATLRRATARGLPQGTGHIAPDALDLLRLAARDRPESVAVEDGAERLTYRRLLADVDRFAARVTAHGVGPGSRVALLLPRGTAAITALLGVLAAGAAYLPLDPDGPVDRVRRVLADAEPSLVVAASTQGTGRYGDGSTPVLAVATYGRGEDVPEPVGVRPPVVPAQPAYVIHTSGSTGVPKGVVVSRAALAAFVRAAAERYGPGPDDRVLQFAPLHFDAAVEEIFLTLSAGATLVLRDAATTASVATLLGECRNRRITWLGLPTAYWNEVAHAVGSPVGPALPDCVHTVVIGGEAALPEPVRRWRRAVGSERVRLVNTYGPTEACVVATSADLAGPRAEYDGGPDVPIGTPLRGVRSAVLDPDGHPTRPGVAGELYLAGDQLADGYLGRDRETADRFATLRHMSGRPRGYRTGDLVRTDGDGRLYHLGRVDDEIKVSGHRLHPAEVEAALLALPGVRQAAVVGRSTGAGLRTIRAFVVPEDIDVPPEVAELRAGLHRALPSAVVPGTITFMAALPLTPAGKTDRAALVAAVPHTNEDAESADHAERLVAEVWRDVLGVAAPHTDDDFFDLGGQSLQTIQVANRLSVRIGRDVTVADVFARPTLGELADLVRSREGAVEPGARDDEYVFEPLPQAVRLQRSAPQPGTVARRVLLTGATGFVGAHLLRRLLSRPGLHIVCLVRGEAPAARLQAALTSWDLPPDLPTDRVTVLGADLRRPDLGLAESDRARLVDGPDPIDAIVHAAAQVSLLRGMASLRRVNIDATASILELASCNGAFVHHLSTLSVASGAPGSTEVPETFIATPPPATAGGYARSKWAAEHLVAQAAGRGLAVAVHRLGRVTGARATAVVNPQDILWRILCTGIPAHALPALHEDEIWTPVDELVDDLARLVVQAPTPGLVVNHAPSAPVPLDRLHAWIRAYGYSVEILPPARWTAAVAGRGPDATTPAILALLDGIAASTGTRDSAPTLGPIRNETLHRLLGRPGTAGRPVDRALVHRYLDQCVRTGLLPPPPHPAATAHIHGNPNTHGPD